MNKKNVIVAITIVLALLLLIKIIYVINDYQETKYQRKQLKSNLDDLIANYQSGEADSIDISSITPFKWDQLYLFRPYSTKEKIDRVLGFQWKGLRSTAIRDSDRIVLFVFVNDGRVTKYMDYPRYPVDFVKVVRDKGYYPSEAIFVVNDGELTLIDDSK